MIGMQRHFVDPNSNNRNLKNGVEVLPQVARCLFGDAHMKCFDDLRVDLAVDDVDQCWIVRICSLDYQALKPPEEYHDSPHKDKFIQAIAEEQRKQAQTISEDIKAQFSPEKGVKTKRCGFC